MEKKKSVLIVINSLELGGAQKSLVSFLKCLVETGEIRRYDIDLLIAKPCGMFYPDVPEEVHMIPSPPELLWLGTPSGDPLLEENPSRRGKVGKLLWKLSLKQVPLHHALNEEQRLWLNWRRLIPEYPKTYDVAVSYMNGFPNYYVIDKVRAARKVLWIHNEYEKLRYDIAFDAPYYDACDQIITISDACKESYLKFYPRHREKIDVLENITLASDILARGEDGDAPEFDGAEHRILSVGRLSAQKQFDLAIRAAAVLKRRGTRFRWLIVGEGEDREELQKQIEREGLSGDFELIGLRTNPYPYLKHCSVFVQTSLFEGKSIVLDEAKIYGKPIIATDYPTVYDNLENEKTGLIVPMEPEAVADAVERVLGDAGLRERLKENLRGAQGNEKELIRYLHLQMGD